MRQTRRLRELLGADGAALAVGAHDALSARLVGEAGFDVVWASGFGISAVRTVPDANVLTMSETLAAVRDMIEASAVPVLVDADSGYGNAINVIRTVRDLGRDGAAGVCLEDNVFPKRCSFYGGVHRELATIDEHAKKIRAAVDARLDDEFVVVARTEALIAGEGVDRALERAIAYADAGADAILVHSKAADASEIHAFAERWDGRLPLVAVPTTYAGTPLGELESCGVRLAIFANQVLRGAIRAMREVLSEMHTAQRADAADARIVPLTDVYELVGLNELQKNESEYAPADPSNTSAVIIAAGFEWGMMPLNRNRPKGMLEAGDATIIGRQIDALRAADVGGISIVRGHKKETVQFEDVRFFDNDRYRETGEAVSLFCAQPMLDGRFVFMYSDILFDPAILHRLLRATGDVVLVVDRALREQPAEEVRRRSPDLVMCESAAEIQRLLGSGGNARIRALGRKLDIADAQGEFIGMALFSPRGAAWLNEVWHDMGSGGEPFGEAPARARAAFTDLVAEMIARGCPVEALDVYRGWMEVNTREDYERVADFVAALDSDGKARADIASQ